MPGGIGPWFGIHAEIRLLTCLPKPEEAGNDIAPHLKVLIGLSFSLNAQLIMSFSF